MPVAGIRGHQAENCRQLGGTRGPQWWERSLLKIVRNPVYKGQRCEQDPRTKEYGKILHELPEPGADRSPDMEAGQ